MSPTFANEIRPNQKVPLVLSDLHNVDFEWPLHEEKEGDGSFLDDD